MGAKASEAGTAKAQKSESRLPAALLVIVFLLITAFTWARWGDPRIDFGGALHRAERIADGAMLYRDVYAHYPPLAPYTVATTLAIFGKHLNVIYALGLLVLVAESILLWRIGRSILDSTQTALALILFWILLGFRPGLFNWVVPNVFANTFASLLATGVVAMIASDIAERRRAKLIWTSLLIAVTGLAKIEYGGAAYLTAVFYVAFVRASPASGSKSNPASRLKDIARLTVPGALVALLVSLLITRWVAWDVVLFDNVYRHRSFSGVLDTYIAGLFLPFSFELGRALLVYGVTFPLAVGLASIGFQQRGKRPLRILAGTTLLLLATGAVYIASRYASAELRFSPDQELAQGVMSQFSWFPPVALALGVAALVFRQRLAPPKVWRILAVLGLFSFFVCLRWGFRVAWAPYYAVFAPFLVVWVVATLSRLLWSDSAATRAGLVLVLSVWIVVGAVVCGYDYRNRSFAIATPRGTLYALHRDAAPMQKILWRLRDELRPGDSVAVVPEEQLINFLSGARHPTRDTGIGPGWLANRADEQRFVDEVLQGPAAFVVVSARRYPEFGAGRIGQYEPWVMRELNRHYRRVGQTRVLGAMNYTLLEHKGRSQE